MTNVTNLKVAIFQMIDDKSTKAYPIKIHSSEVVPALSQLETPLFDVLLKHRNRHPIQFHIPGHKKALAWIQRFESSSATTFYQLI